MSMSALTISAAPAPVCVPPPAGQCPIIMRPGCVYPAVVADCARPVPSMSDASLWLLTVMIVAMVRVARGGR